MFLFKENFALFTHNLDKAIRFYQDSFNLRMYNLDVDNKEVLLENLSDSKLLRLVELENFSPSDITIYSDEISVPHKLHTKQGIVISEDPANAVYSVKDLDGNTIRIIGETEQIIFGTSENCNNNSDISDDQELDEISE